MKYTEKKGQKEKQRTNKIPDREQKQSEKATKIGKTKNKIK